MARRLEDLGREVLGRAAERVRLGPLLDLRGARGPPRAPRREERARTRLQKEKLREGISAC